MMLPRRLWPRSLLVRTFFLIVFLVALANMAWVVIFFRLDDSGPRSLAQLSASAVNLVRVALLTADPELRPVLLKELSDQEGIRLLPSDSSDVVVPLPSEHFWTETHAQLRQLLGPETRFSLSVNQEPGLWISFAITPGEVDEYWLILSKSRVPNWRTSWLLWGGLAIFLALAAAWFMAFRINRPLSRMAQAARQVGLGHMPPPLPEEGPDELLRLSQAFNRMSRDLAYNEKERAEILAGISHDLRTPLTRMRLEAELSLPEGPALAGMVADIAQMDAIITQFLDYARGEGEELTEAADPKALLESIGQHQQSIQKPVHLEIEALPTAPLRPRAISRALGNLVDNAWKYGAPPVTLSGRIHKGYLEFAVQDDGEGIPAAERERLKQPFTRRETARSGASGTGLGLAIVERIARNHGGSLELTDGPQGRGLLAILRLPLRRVES
jgi:two-component system osmolarity sensor histidine kinase EnvZ